MYYVVIITRPEMNNSRVAILNVEVSRCQRRLRGLSVVGAARRWLLLTGSYDFLLVFYGNRRKRCRVVSRYSLQNRNPEQQQQEEQ